MCRRSAPGSRWNSELFQRFSTQQIHQRQTLGHEIQEGGGGRLEQRHCSANRYPIPRSTAQNLPHFLNPAGSFFNFLERRSETAPMAQRRRSKNAETETERLKSLPFLYSKSFMLKYLAHTGTILIPSDILICVGNNACSYEIGFVLPIPV